MTEAKRPAIPEGKISDYINGRIRNDTPEEYVRQTIEKRLVKEHGYSPEQIRVEHAVQVHSSKPRLDLAIFDRDCGSFEKENIRIIIECKRESVEASSKRDGVEQLKSYMLACEGCEWGMWTNGRQKEVFRKLVAENKTVFEEYNDIPSADGSLDEINRPTRQSLKSAYDDNLLMVFRTCHNHIYVNDGLQKQPAFFELLKIIFCKIEDERAGLTKPLNFYTTSQERSNTQGQLTVFKRISRIFDRVKRKHGKIFDGDDTIKLHPRSVAYIVGELQKYSLLKTNIDVKAKAYEEIVGSNLRGDRGEFFTPHNVINMTVAMLAPRIDEKVLDSSCGIGGFVVAAYNHAVMRFQKDCEERIGLPRAQWDLDDERQFLEQIREADANFFGFDLNPDLVKNTKMNMVMNGATGDHVFQTNSLLPPHEWSAEFRRKLAEALGVKPGELRNHKTIGRFDVILTNPPFGSKIPVKDRHILEQFQLAHIWEKREGRWTMTDRLQSSVPPEILFIERCMQFLKPGGRLGIVLPDSILGAPGLEYIREWMLQNTRIVASVDLHVDAFQPHNGTQTSVLILQKRPRRAGENYKIFMAMVEKVGHDKRGNPLFLRDELGNEILVPDQEADRDAVEDAPIRMKKAIDDQTGRVAELFAQWFDQEMVSWQMD